MRSTASAGALLGMGSEFVPLVGLQTGLSAHARLAAHCPCSALGLALVQRQPPPPLDDSLLWFTPPTVKGLRRVDPGG